MDLYRFDGRRRLSVTLDAGYVSIMPITVCQSSTTFDLHGKKLIWILCAIITLFLISVINLTVGFSDFWINEMRKFGIKYIRNVFLDIEEMDRIVTVTVHYCDAFS